jgi:hypothetical protein
MYMAATPRHFNEFVAGYPIQEEGLSDYEVHIWTRWDQCDRLSANIPQSQEVNKALNAALSNLERVYLAHFGSGLMPMLDLVFSVPWSKGKGQIRGHKEFPTFGQKVKGLLLVLSMRKAWGSLSKGKRPI